MTFQSRTCEGLDRPSLERHAARHGWYLKTPARTILGFGPPAAVLELPRGLKDPSHALDVLRDVALHSNLPIKAFASLPFDRRARGALAVPSVTLVFEGESVICQAVEGVDLPDVTQEPEAIQGLLEASDVTYSPSPAAYSHLVAQAVDRLRKNELGKVVLARSIRGSLSADVDPAALIARLGEREPRCTIYSFPTDDGRRFIGATPELLVERTGATAAAHPLAGTIALSPDSDETDYQDWLLGSVKNRHEHAVVAREVADRLATTYDDVSADSEPHLVRLRTLAHLGTWIHATSEHEVDAPDALEILRLVHPTAAVGGIPRDEAYRLIVELEGLDRGVYAGPLGWMDSRGDGEWWVGFRGVLCAGNSFEAWAGAGIVSESDPIAEQAETHAKLNSVLGALVNHEL